MLADDVEHVVHGRSSKNGSTYFQRIHALDITTGAEEFGGPPLVAATFPGNGDNSHNG